MEKLYGLIGEKLGHTYSPAIHREILNEIHISGHYGILQVKRENLEHAVLGLKTLSYDGVNVTIPYKTEIIKYLDSLSEEAEKIGAVNVVSFNKDGKAIGYNTDYYGFGMMLNHASIKVMGESAVILGTGGVSKAVFHYLKDNGIRDIVLLSRDINSAKNAYPDKYIKSYDELPKLKGFSIIINCTPAGMYPDIDSTPINEKFLKNFSHAVDLVYNPVKTRFLKEAEKQGLNTVNGLYMLVAQAVKSQELWNNIKIPEESVLNITNLIKQELV